MPWGLVYAIGPAVMASIQAESGVYSANLGKPEPPRSTNCISCGAPLDPPITGEQASALALVGGLAAWRPFCSYCRTPRW